jgi:phosphatidylserine decarboxylase
MKLHKEGTQIIIISAILLIVLGIIPVWIFPKITIFHFLFWIVEAVFCFLIVRFFRIPNRILKLDENAVLCPADGHVVVVEKVRLQEYLNEERIQVSIFMSPNDVHVNRYPISGTVRYKKYHPGKFLVAWCPKSSELNERTSVLVENDRQQSVMIRQIAGAVARRIVCYSEENTNIKQGEELGFIKFGSRVDLFLPLEAEVLVKIDQKVKGGIDHIAHL